MGDGAHDIDIVENEVAFFVNWDKTLGLTPPLKKWGTSFTLTEWIY